MSYLHEPNNDFSSDEDQEESSTEPVDELTAFREQWQKDLQSAKELEPKMKQLQISNNNLCDNESVEKKAKNLFLQGTEHEKSGKLYEAIQFYKKAEQLVPDIEFRYYESTKSKQNEIKESLETSDVLNSIEVTNKEIDSENNEYDTDDCDISEKLSRIVERNGCVCFSQTEQNTTHISSLPMEIFLYIFRWVVSSDLDIRSLDILSKVCRGFYVCSRDPEIWRMACMKVWGINCKKANPEFSSWREMFLKSPRLRFDGCYISKTTYIRPGENSFQDQYYKPWHLVEYFRYLRFFPEKKVLMLTSTDDAQSCVTSLKSPDPRNTSVLVGHYRLNNNCVTLILKRQDIKNNATSFSYRKRKRPEFIHDSGEQTYHIEFEIQNFHKRRNVQLSWLRYIIYTKYKNGQEISSQLNLAGRYTSFKFSRVKSYTQESILPLQ